MAAAAETDNTMRDLNNPRGFTLIEALIATLITAMIAAMVAGLVSAFHSSTRLQDVRAAAVLRTAAIQSHLARQLLRTRMLLQQDESRVLLWLPSETLEESSGQAGESAFDRIDLAEGELVWLDLVEAADGTWDLMESVVVAESLAEEDLYAYFTTDAEYWNSLRDSLEAGDKLKTYPIVEAISPMKSPDGTVADAPRLLFGSEEVCSTWSVGVEYAIVEASDDGELEEMRIDVRIDEAIPFPDQHPICTN